MPKYIDEQTKPKQVKYFLFRQVILDKSMRVGM